MSSIMVLGLGMVLIIDFRSERAQRLSEKSVALHDEAALLLPMIQQLRHHGLEGVQQFVDDACAAMQETTSPGHHIAVELGPAVIQARSHHRATPEMLQALRAGAQAGDHRTYLGVEPLLVGTAHRDDASVYVSEYVDNVLRTSRRETLWRSGWIALVGIFATAILDWVLLRLIAHPINSLVSTVRQIGQGQLGSRASAMNSVELQFLADEVNTMSATLAEERSHRSRQMDKARRIQERLRPASGQIGGWCIASLYSPAEEVGGDYFDYRMINEGLLVACVADVTGHGVPAAMGAAMLKTLFSAAVARYQNPAEILRHINDGFRVVSLEEDFASMIVVTLDQATSRLRYASAGHEPAYLLRHNAEPIVLESTGILVGIDADAEYETAEIILQPGDRLAMPTDGWAEARLANGQMFGRDSLIGVLQKCLPNPVEEMLARALHRLQSSVAEPASDDLTLLVIDWPHEVNRA